MTYRLIFDFGDIEVTVYHKTNETDREKIVEGALNQVIERGFGFPREPTNYTDVVPCPEWDEE